MKLTLERAIELNKDMVTQDNLMSCPTNGQQHFENLIHYLHFS